MTEKATLTTFLLFEKDLEEALDFYSATFKDVVIHSKNRMGDEGPLFTSDFSILGMNSSASIGAGDQNLTTRFPC